MSAFSASLMLQSLEACHAPLMEASAWLLKSWANKSVIPVVLILFWKYVGMSQILEAYLQSKNFSIDFKGSLCHGFLILKQTHLCLVEVKNTRSQEVLNTKSLPFENDAIAPPNKGRSIHNAPNAFYTKYWNSTRNTYVYIHQINRLSRLDQTVPKKQDLAFAQALP